jgi:hypothetical protein
MKARTNTLFFALLLTAAVTPLAANAECYGDAAAMYGCGSQGRAPSASREGTLESFGDARAPVLPDVRSSGESSAIDDVVTPMDRRRILRSVVLGSGRRPYSQRSHVQAINNSSRPLRLSGSVSQPGRR